MANTTPTTATETKTPCSGSNWDGSDCTRKAVKTVGTFRVRHYCRECYAEYIQDCRDEASEARATDRVYRLAEALSPEDCDA